MQAFVIEDITWYRHVSATYDIKLRLHALVHFLARTGLLVNTSLLDGDQVPDTFKLRDTDLTPAGLEFLKKYYQKWVTSIDRGKPPGDTSYLEKSYTKFIST